MVFMARRLGRTIVRWLMIAVLLAGAVAGTWWIYSRYAEPQVTVTEVRAAEVVQAFYATGTLLPVREYSVNSNVEGTLVRVLKDKGDAVAAGEELAWVDAQEFRMRLAQAQADADLKRQLADEPASPLLREFDDRLKAAAEQRDIAARELARIRALRAGGSTSQSDEDRANDQYQATWSLAESLTTQKKTRILELKRDLRVAEEALRIAQWNFDQEKIVSPTRGRVLDRPVSPGTRVRINDHIMQVADVSPDGMVLRAAVDEENRTQVWEGQGVRVTLYAYAGQVFSGRVVTIYPKADLDRRTFEVDVKMEPADPAFAAGMTGEIAFIVARKQGASVVPSQAVLVGETVVRSGEAATAPAAPAPGSPVVGSVISTGVPVRPGVVWVVRDGRLLRRAVTVGLRSIDRTEILAGLEPGDRVVISPLDGLTAGRLVQAKYMNPVEAADANRPVEQKPIKGFN